MSAASDDEPPGVIDDPTVRSYESAPKPGSTPFNLDEWAKDDPLTQLCSTRSGRNAARPMAES